MGEGGSGAGTRAGSVFSSRKASRAGEGGRRGAVAEGEGCVSGVWTCALALGEVQHKRGWPREDLTPEPTSFSKYFCM